MLVWIVIKQIVISFLLMLIGVICYKKNILGTKVSESLSDFVLTIVSPALILNACQITYSKELVHNLLWAFAMSALSYFIVIILSNICIRKNRENYNIERFSIVYSNCGFIGIPIVSAIFGDEGVLYLTCYIAMFNILLWTHGVICMSGKSDRHQLTAILKCPTIIAIVVGLLSFGFKITYPEIIGKTICYVAEMNTPLAMIVAGISITEADIRLALRQKRVYFLTILKLVVMPVLVWLAMLPFHLNEMVLMTIVLATGCPTGATGIMFALRYHKDEQYASEIFAVTTVFTVITMPLLIFICTLC